MSSTTAAPATFSGEELTKLLALIKEADSVELKLTVPEIRPALCRGRARPRSAGGADPPGLLLRHAGAWHSTSRASSSAPAGSRARATTRPSSCGRSYRRSCRTTCARSAELPRRGRRAARRLRLLGRVERGAALDRRHEGRRGRAPAAKALLQGAAGVLRRARAGGNRPGRPLDPRADLRAQAPHHARGSSAAGSSPSCGSTPTAPASSSSRPAAAPPRRSRSRPSSARSSPRAGSTSRASRRRRRARRSSTSRTSRTRAP